MKKYTKIFMLALSLALLMATVFSITATAEGEGKGDIYSSTIVHDDKIGIAFAVQATAAELADGTVEVKYVWDGSEVVKTAHYHSAHESKEGYVWVVTEGVAAYDLALNANVTTYYNGEVVETGSYSVATFLYNKLYRSKVTGEAKACYEALLEYGATSQAYLNRNNDNPVNALDYAYTNVSGVKINGGLYAFGSNVTLSYEGDFVVDSFVVNGVTYPATNGSCEAVIDGVCEVGVVYAEDLTITVGNKSFTADNGTWAYNQAVSPIWKYQVVIYDNTFSGTLIGDTYGMALVIDSEGNLKEIYDSFNGGYHYTETNGTRVKYDIKNNNYVQSAFNSLSDGDILVIAPRYYPDANTKNPAVIWAQELRFGKFIGNDVYEGSYIGMAATLTYTPAEK